MPEGHTIHRIARDHTRGLAGQKLILLSPQGRFADEAKLLSGKKLTRVYAHGKHLFYQFGGKSKASQKLVHVHLGLYGKFRKHRNPAPEPRGAVRVRMIGSDQTVDLNGPTRCEILTRKELDALRNRLGQDPLDENAEPSIALEKIGRSRSAIGALLLNQSIIAGIGNVYRAEILFLLGIHPERAGNSLEDGQIEELWDLTVKLLKIGVKNNRIITVDRKRAGKPLSRLTKQERLLCYKKINCTTCGTAIRKWELGARTMYACEECQT